ncbi:ubiquitin ligase (cullin) of SCF [Elasticomyces elasticus]|uniref:Ubiquitin ligase (Cullin) of SCF n=1 Tax=Exophiala sideris TaxID=1016849 RepID=A0ABR0JD32_9EURO|nr:ubiquitin ligase (cullin) of SCF [Elasticomyces elasticus]KAK5030571.1 ubiquitin ligase (cullin) of SCF [Exophiala sideris]KAK5038625.1 ubiquitin ligase (cullin) of SCF [Exophiala sideris]KAK5060506.1 ubiquitin ligase (cullin) of SCF [Exophiala sideris]KAK5183418.1 ubiquitin ligase (cullin) of SCF [Eurotiomycetes sp. CCFEE 6388]
MSRDLLPDGVTVTGAVPVSAYSHSNLARDGIITIHIKVNNTLILDLQLIMAPATAAAPATATVPSLRARDDLSSTWTYLEKNLDNVMTKLQEGLDMKTYMGVYTAVHNFCTSQKAASTQTQSTPSALSANHRGAHLLGEELYTLLGQYLTEHLKGVLIQSESHTDEALLTFYIREWKRYTDAAKYNNHLFRYLNRHWVKREIDEGKKNVYDVYTLHLVRWRDDFFMDVQSKVMHSVLRLVEKQRNGETIDQMQIKAIVDSFVSLGLDELDSTKSTLDVYRQYFERPFIAATKDYYTMESKRFVAENSVVEYMKKAEARLDEEKERVGLYLHPDIMKKLMETCNESLISAHSVLLRDEFQVLLDNERTDDLARMYKLLSRIKDGLDPLRNRFEVHVRKAGLAAVEKVAASGDNFEPKVYVDALLEIHGKYQQLVNVAFNGESEFVRSLDNACQEFVNHNQVCKSNTTRSPELLAKYADQLLKKGAKAADESELEELLVQIMVVFKYIEDKDVFQKFYSRMLAKRLVHTSSVSDDAETSMISKLKEACGYEYTNKLQRMFQDVQISKDLNTAYKDWHDKILDDSDEKRTVDSTFQILGTGFWPLNAPNTPFAPPAEVSKAMESFTRFYDQKHNGRKLTWLWQLCKGEIRANYIKSQKVPYTFQVSTYQMAILLLFNESDKIDYSEIKELTKLTDENLEPAIGILCKARVLLPSPEDGKAVPGTNYALNYNFKNKKVKINLNITVKSEQKVESEDTHKTIEEDRKLLLQAVIVRIMKGRKKLKHVHLVEEVINQVRNRFPPKISDIKKNIDALMEKDYIERLDNDELAYIA